jgi:hypothetical protein
MRARDIRSPLREAIVERIVLTSEDERVERESRSQEAREKNEREGRAVKEGGSEYPRQ